jgi:hypothetical protein
VALQSAADEYAVPIPLLKAGRDAAHRVELTHSGESGTYVDVDSLIVKRVSRPWLY